MFLIVTLNMHIWNTLIYEITSIHITTVYLLRNFSLLGTIGTSFTFERILSIYSYTIILYFVLQASGSFI